MTKSKGILAPRHKWTGQELIFLAERYPNERASDIAQALGLSLAVVYAKANKLGLGKSEEFKASNKSGRILRGKQNEAKKLNRFKPGNRPWNKGTKGLQIGGVQTQFKPGERPINHKPIGSTRIRSEDGYVLVKVAEGLHQWKMLNRENWKKAHGEYPPKTHVLRFKDGNKLNCDVSNLEMISKAEHVNRVGIHSYPPEIKNAMLLRGALNRKINTIKKKQNEQTK